MTNRKRGINQLFQVSNVCGARKPVQHGYRARLAKLAKTLARKFLIVDYD
jgi:hypothetical protein